MKNIDIIYLKLDTLGERIVSMKQLLNLITDVTHDNQEKYLKQLRENGKIKAIFQNYYYILSENERKSTILDYSNNELVYGVLNKLNLKWYISFEKGLELNNVLWQAHRKTTILNNKISKRTIILDSEFEFKKTKSTYMQSYEQTKTKNRITQNIGLNEKIFIDYIYFKKRVPLELLSNIDKLKVKTMLRSYPHNFQNKVKGVLVENE